MRSKTMLHPSVVWLGSSARCVIFIPIPLLWLHLKVFFSSVLFVRSVSPATTELRGNSLQCREPGKICVPVKCPNRSQLGHYYIEQTLIFNSVWLQRRVKPLSTNSKYLVDGRTRPYRLGPTARVKKSLCL